MNQNASHENMLYRLLGDLEKQILPAVQSGAYRVVTGGAPSAVMFDEQKGATGW